MTSISIVTTCKNRLHHLRETLPLMVAQGADQVIVVDYGDPDHAGDWAEANFPGVIVVRVDDDPEFSTSRSRNLGAAVATSDWLGFVDADAMMAHGWVDWLRENVRPQHYYKAGAVKDGFISPTFGTSVCERAAFESVGGYDEVIRGWGGEDVDLYDRLLLIGMQVDYYPARFISSIHHGDEQRAGWGGMRNMKEKVLVDKLYLSLKRHVLMVQGQHALTVELRQGIFDHVVRGVQSWYAEGRVRPLSLSYTLPYGRPQMLDDSNLASGELTMTLKAEHKPESEAS